MRLMYCRECKTLTKLKDFDGGNPDDDRLLVDWIDRHMHGISIDQHPGAIPFKMDPPNLSASPNRTMELNARGIDNIEDDPAFERAAVEKVKGILAKNQHDVFGDLRDELKDDALKCFDKHHHPELPGKPCIDYHAASKRLGRRDQPMTDLAYLCTYCPYESSVVVEKRAKRGDYR